MPGKQGPHSTFSVARLVREAWTYWRQPHTQGRSYPNYQVVTERADAPHSSEQTPYQSCLLVALTVIALPVAVLFGLFVWGPVVAVVFGLLCLLLVCYALVSFILSIKRA